MKDYSKSQATLQRRLDEALADALPLTDPRAEPARLYLAKQLGINLDEFPADLRYHPALPYFRTTKGKLKGKHPALLALVRDSDYQVVTVLRVYLTPDGDLAPTHGNHKIMTPAMPDALQGASIQLFAPDRELLITDSIEEALRLHISMGVPVWATICRWAAARAVVPNDVEKVTLILRGAR
jgi:putative DNA primase/helicase